MEDSGEFFRHKPAGFEVDDKSDGDNQEELQEIQPKKLIIMKFTDTGRAYLRKVKHGSLHSKSAGSRNKRNLSIFTGLSTTLSPMKQHTPRTAPLLPPRQPVRREIIGWNPPKRPPNFPRPTRMNDFTRQLLNLSKQELSGNTETAEGALSSAISTRRGSVSGPSPAWSPISDQGSPSEPPKPPGHSSPGNSNKRPGLHEPSSSPQFASTVNDIPNLPDPTSPLLMRARSLAPLITPATSPASRALNGEQSVYSPSEASEPADQRPGKQALFSGRARASPGNKASDKATPSPKGSTAKRPYNKISPYWANRSTYKEPAHFDGTASAQAPLSLRNHSREVHDQPASCSHVGLESL